MTYLIRRFTLNEAHPDYRRVIKRGLSLAEAQEHCQREDTHEPRPDGTVAWFDGYENEGTDDDDDS